MVELGLVHILLRLVDFPIEAKEEQDDTDQSTQTRVPIKSSHTSPQITKDVSVLRQRLVNPERLAIRDGLIEPVRLDNLDRPHTVPSKWPSHAPSTISSPEPISSPLAHILRGDRKVICERWIV